MLWGYQVLCKGIREEAKSGNPPRLKWLPSSNGKFTNASAYELLRQTEGGQPCVSPWSSIWQLKGPTRRSLLLWLVCHDRLKTNFLLWSRNIVEDATCMICGEEIEATLHAVRDCKLPQQVWSFLILAMVYTTDWKTCDPALWI